jgi:hypothetical protein
MCVSRKNEKEGNFFIVVRKKEKIWGSTNERKIDPQHKFVVRN